MIDDTSFPESSPEPSASSPDTSAAPVGYCQECGRPLAAAALRRVGNSIFCEPCASHRQPSPGWQPVNAGVYSAGVGTGAPPRASGEPNPVFAGLLGLIPGVGAMYNGQYGKGAAHLIVFVVLVTLADNLNWVFYWLVWGWVFYQAFDAFHTARARRDGLPLPNPFGWNDLGERLGFNRTSPPAGPPPVRSADLPGSAQQRSNASWPGYVAPPPPPQARYAPYPEGQNRVSDNPYTAPYAPPAAAPIPPMPSTPTNVAYFPTYTGTVTGHAGASPLAPVRTHRFPAGAVWLIGLGVLFLVGNLQPEWRLSGKWLVPLMLAAAAIWSALRRWEQFRSVSQAAGSSPSFAAAMTGPVFLLTVSLLLALQAGGIVALKRSWPVLIVVWGGVLLVQRVSGHPIPYVPTEMAGMAQTASPPVRSTSGTGSLGL